MFATNSVFALILAACYGLTMVCAQRCTFHYVVRPGDTCNKISQELGVSTYQLFSLNRFINPECTNLSPGEVLCIVVGSDWCRPVYTVEHGDTCQSIADRHGITVGSLHHHNPNINPECTNLGVGEVLCVAPAFNLVPQFGVNNRYNRGGCGAV